VLVVEGMDAAQMWAPSAHVVLQPEVDRAQSSTQELAPTAVAPSAQRCSELASTAVAPPAQMCSQQVLLHSQPVTSMQRCSELAPTSVAPLAQMCSNQVLSQPAMCMQEFSQPEQQVLPPWDWQTCLKDGKQGLQGAEGEAEGEDPGTCPALASPRAPVQGMILKKGRWVPMEQVEADLQASSKAPVVPQCSGALGKGSVASPLSSVSCSASATSSDGAEAQGVDELLKSGQIQAGDGDLLMQLLRMENDLKLLGSACDAEAGARLSCEVQQVRAAILDRASNYY
jgi:hypothetical protein